MQVVSWVIFIGLVLLWNVAVSSTTSPRELKAIKSLYSKKRGKERANYASKPSMMGVGGEYVPDVGPWSSEAKEPTCEQLRQMWRQSKRHSRAAETTNEIPQYVDPFARASLQAYARQIGEPTLRPRPERRPVVYGRIHQSAGEEPDKPVRPFDVLRKLNGREHGKSEAETDATGAVLFSEDDKSSYTKAAAKGSVPH